MLSGLFVVRTQLLTPMTSSLDYKRNAKRTETNVIGDGLPLTNFQNAKRLEMPTS